MARRNITATLYAFNAMLARAGRRRRRRRARFEQIHPGPILKRKLEARNLSAAALALKLRIAPERIQEIVAARRAISPETALRLGRFFGNEPECWLAMLRASIGPRIEAEAEAAA